MPAKRVLVVDDDESMRDFLCCSLEGAGYSVEGAQDASEALEKFNSSTFDLVISDLRLPGMQGDQLADELRKRCPTQRIMLVTGLPLETPVPSVNATLPKPFGLAAFRNAVAQVL